MIHIEKARKIYGQPPSQVIAINDIDLEIKNSDFCALIGPSGSGKSTLLNLVGGLDDLDGGRIMFDNQDLSEKSSHQLSDFRRDNIGFIFQSYNLIPVLTALENIEYVLLLQGVEKSVRRDKSRKILHRLGLEGYENRRPNALSGGQQQRVAVARAIVSKPKVVLADEPTANLDTQNGIALIEIMRELNEQDGITFIFSTHDPKIMDSARRIIAMRDGRIESDIYKN